MGVQPPLKINKGPGMLLSPLPSLFMLAPFLSRNAKATERWRGSSFGLLSSRNFVWLELD